MKLFFLIKSLEGRGGGAERVLCSVANALADLGHHITLATFDRVGFTPHYRIHQQIDTIGLGGASLRSTNPRDFLHSVRQLRKLGLKDYDALIGFMHSSYVPLAFAALGTGKPVIASEHTTAQHFTDKPLQSFLSGIATRLAYAKTVVSPLVWKEASRSQQRKIQVISNPVDFAAYQHGRDTEIRNPIILCPGILRPEKGQMILIDAFERIAETRPEWRLRIIGDGPLMEQLQDRVASSPLRDRIELPGFVDDVAAEYAAASFVVLPSFYESFGMAIAEAMASGRPAICLADCHGATLLIDDEKNGLIAPVHEDRAAGIADTMARLMDSPDLLRELGANAPAGIEQYSVASIAEKWEKLLYEAASN